MTSFAEFTKKKKKKSAEGLSFKEYTESLLGVEVERELAPVKTPITKVDAPVKDERTWFQKSAYFDDGYQFLDYSKSILGTYKDVEENIATGILGIGEKAIDTGAYLLGGAGGLLGADKFKGKMQDFIQKDIIDEEKLAKKMSIFGSPVTQMANYALKHTGKDVDEASFLGEKADSLAQSGGQLGATFALQSVGVPWYLTTGVTSFGGEAENALNQGATFGEAGGSALITASADILTERLSGGIKFGGKTLDDVALKPLVDKISNKAVKTLTNFGIDVVGEGAEEVIASIISNLGSSLYKEESIEELLTSEEAVDEYIESFIGGMVLGGGVSGVNTVASMKSGRDYKTGLTENEQKVIDKEVENRIDGKELTKKEKAEIEAQVKEDLQKGNISIDTIESVLDSDNYNSYQNLLSESEEFKTLYETESGKLSEKQKDRLAYLKESNEKQSYESRISEYKDTASQRMNEMLVKDTFLQESYKEKTRRSQKFEADLTKYDEKQQEVIKKAVDSGILNNTNKTHEFVDMIAKISADKGVLFDFTTNEALKESGFAIEGKTVNGFVKDGNIALNINSNKALNTVVGHEITHILEGTELYNELQTAVVEYATTKGDYNARKEALAKLYEGVDNVNLENEVTADLVGDYLFTDSDFINSLSTKKPNVFKKIYDEIKYFLKVATAGSKEARQLEQVKRAFDKAYKETAKNTEVNDVNFSLVGKENGIEVYETSDSTKELSYKERKQKLLDTMKNEFAGRTAKFTKDGEVYYAFYDKDGLNKGVYGDKKSDKKGYKAKINIGADGNYVELAENALYVDSSAESGKENRFHKDAKEWDYYVKTVKSDGVYYDVLVNVKNTGDNQFVYDITLKETGSLPEQLSSYDGSSPVSDTNIPQIQENATEITNNADTKYSLSEDSEGNAVSPAVQKRFKNSKAVDENGSLKVLYHGTPSGEFTIFDKTKGSVEGDFGSGFYFTDNEADVETNYEGGGPDFENKVARRAEQIEAEEDIDYDEAEQRAREELYKGSNKFEVYLNVENPAIVGETILLDQESYLENYDPDDYDDYDDYIAEVEQLVADDIENIVWEVEKNVDLYSTDGISDVLFDAYYEGGIGIEDLKARINELYLEDSEGNMAGNEVTRQIIESLGYDGIIDSTVSSKFRNMGIEEGTTHYIVFKPNQIKSITNQNPTDNPDINLSLSDKKDIAPTGKYNVYGKDIALERTVSKTENVAPVVQEKTDLVQEVVQDAPIQSENWRDIASNLTEYNPAIADRVAELSVREVIADVDSGMSASDLMRKSQEASKAYDQLMAQKPREEAYTPALELLLTTYYSQYSMYDSVARNRDFVNQYKAIFEEKYAPMTETQANERDLQTSDRIHTLDESQSPMESDLYDDLDDIFASSTPEPKSPFDEMDIQEVGDRKQKAYMYENPEVKPYFQEEAKVMLGELRNSQKGERSYNDQLYYESGGEKGFFGTKRETSEQIAYLLDKFKYKYADIEKGLNAIIEDHGAENNAISKRIEFMLDERLKNGYTDFVSGMEIPANQEYLNFLTEKDIQEYSEEARMQYFESPEFAYSVSENTEDTAPVEEVAPVKDVAYEAIRPQRQKEPKLIRVKDNTTPEYEEIAKILDAEPTTNKKNRWWAIFRANVLDKGSVFEDIALKNKNRNLMGKWNYTLYSESIAQRFMGNGNPEAGVKALNDIRAEVDNTGLTHEFSEYIYHKHNVDRMKLKERFDIENKPVFGYNITAEASEDIVKLYENAHPEFMDYAQDVYNYQNYLRQQLVDNGVISQETADLWSEMYPHYVPIRRINTRGNNINVALDTGRTGVNAPIKKATGGNSDILPLFDTMAMRTLQTYKATAKNSFGVELKNTLGTTIDKGSTNVDEVIESIDSQEELLQKGKNGEKPTFTVFENGERVTFEITEDMYDAIKPISEGLRTELAWGLPGKISAFHRGVLTQYNPVFILTNGIKDIQDVLINSQHPARTYAKIPEAFAQLTKKGYWYNEYMNNGGDYNSFFDGETNTFKTDNKGLSKLLELPPLSTISQLNNYIEMIPRLSEYIASREAGRSIEVSMLDSARVTTNFRAGGDLTKYANRNGATFLNASVQGALQQVRNVREAKANGLKGWANLATKFALAGAPAFLLNALLWDDDDEYEELSDYVKQNYYIVGKYDDGKFIRIPKGRTVAVIQDAIKQVSDMATGNGEEDLNSFLQLVVTNLAPANPIENNILAPIVQVNQNKTWYGDDLVPTRLKDLPASEQYDESTDSISRWLGEQLDYSPVKINYLLDQYTGGVGDMVLPMLTPEAESGDNSPLGNAIAPLKKKFTVDSVMNNQNISDFYDTSDELTTNAKKSTATDEDVLKNKYMNSIKAEMSDLYKQKREVQSSSLSDNMKYERVREIQSQIVALSKEGLKAHKGVSIMGDYATVGDRHYKRSESGEWTKLTDKELEKLEEVTSGLGISASEYWRNKEEYNLAYEKPGEYAMSKVFGGYDNYKNYTSEIKEFEADKDENGKTINGSRKEKVLAYVDSLDADYGTKLILFKSVYNAEDDFNNDIIEYLNSRNDISYEEEVAILKELGFTVDSDGTIYWD